MIQAHLERNVLMLRRFFETVVALAEACRALGDSADVESYVSAAEALLALTDRSVDVEPLRARLRALR